MATVDILIPSELAQPAQQPCSPVEITREDLHLTVRSNLKTFIQKATEILERHRDIMEPESDKERITNAFNKLITNLKNIQLHFTFVSELMAAQEETEIDDIKKAFLTVSPSYDALTRLSHVCVVAINQSLDTVVKTIFEEVEKIANDFFVGKNKQKYNKAKENIYHVEIVASKLETTIEYFPKIVTLPTEDLFSRRKSSSVWKKIHTAAHFKTVGEKAKIKTSIAKFAGMLTIANAVVYSSDKNEVRTNGRGFGALMSGIKGLYYTANSSKAETRASLYFSDPRMDSAFAVWNLPENKFIKELYKLTLPSIKYDKKIYVPRVFPMITKESILKEYMEGTINKIQKSDFVAPDLSDQKEEILKTLFDKNKERVKIRIIAPWYVDIKGKRKGKSPTLETIANKLSFSPTLENKPKINGALIHIHGGGFVSMSSSAHRNYLYRWAKALNMIIFSIDYRLAPQDPYPAAVDDVWQAYNWLINYAEPILGINMDKVVVTGDSAGGNIAMSLTLRTIKEQVRVPDGCLLSYPALNLYPEKFVPSYFIAIDDIILPYNVLKLCIKAYVPQDCDPTIDPFLSAITASDELLSQLPPVQILTGTNDPLHDDIWKLTQKLQGLEKDVKVTVYEGMPHGYLSFEGIIGYEMMIRDAVDKMLELFDNADNADKNI